MDSENVIRQAKELLSNDYLQEKNILNTISSGHSDAINRVQSAKLNPRQIFSEEAIKNICIKYRLRFLDAELFKGEIPYDAFLKIKELNKQHETEIKKFKIMAPGRLFQLRDADADPLLFIPTEDGNYYLIHKWGTDLAWYKKIWHLPSRSLESLVFTILFFCLIFTFLIPNDWLIPPSNMAVNGIFGYWGFHRVSFFFHSIILTCGITIFYWFAFHKNFSKAEWNKKTFN